MLVILAPIFRESDMTAATTLYSADGHEVLRFDSLVGAGGIQANQFVVLHDDHAAVLDPGGDLTYTPLTIELGRRIRVQDLDYVLSSHQDPDIIASLPRWLIHTRCQVVTSKLWSRFLPHLASSFVTDKMGADLESRIIAVPDRGAVLPFGNSSLHVLPAHFLHSVGNFSFFDPVSRILFSGDIGASVGGEEGEVTDFRSHVASMEGFHRRYMTGNRPCRLWAAMVRRLAPAMIVPQHGGYFAGEAVIAAFLGWFAELECGIDLLDAADYQLPKQ